MDCTDYGIQVNLLWHRVSLLFFKIKLKNAIKSDVNAVSGFLFLLDKLKHARKSDLNAVPGPLIVFKDKLKNAFKSNLIPGYFLKASSKMHANQI